MKWIRYVLVTLLILMVIACEHIEETSKEQQSVHVKYGEQTKLEEALSAVSFTPKKMNEEKAPFKIRKKVGKVIKTDQPSEILELGYGGYGHSITLVVESSKELMKDTSQEWDNSMRFEEITLENGITALYAESENAHHLLWIESELSYFMNLNYKRGVSPKPERFSKQEVIEIVNNME